MAQNGIERLRHILFMLAMRGAPARSIQELAGHKDLATTQRYMHLSSAAVDSARLTAAFISGGPRSAPSAVWCKRVRVHQQSRRTLRHVIVALGCQCLEARARASRRRRWR